MLQAGPLGSECPLRWSPDQLPTSISAPHMVLLQSLRSFPSRFPQTPWILTPTPEFGERLVPALCGLRNVFLFWQMKSLLSALAQGQCCPVIGFAVTHPTLSQQGLSLGMCLMPLLETTMTHPPNNSRGKLCGRLTHPREWDDNTQRMPRKEEF